VRYDILVDERRAGLALPGDRSAFEEFGKEVRFLFEEVLVVGQVIPEERERVDAGTSSEDHFRPTTGDRVERRVALEHPDRIVRAQYRDSRTDADPGRTGGDGAEHHVGGRQREVISVVLTDPEEVHPHLVGEHTLFDEVPDRLGMREWAVIIVMRDIAEGVEAEDKGELRKCCGHVESLGLV
jgi:hypothetical protein